MRYFDQRPRGQRLIGIVVIPNSSHALPLEHFENPFRTDEMVQTLRKQSFWEDLYVFYPRVASFRELCYVHDPAYVTLVRNASHGGEGWLDSDTLIQPGSYEGAATSAGAVLNAIDAVGMVAYTRMDHVFALVRPCGHHARPGRAQGSCIFANAAIGAKYARDIYGCERIAIIDWDVHHGNGTQEIFYDDAGVFFCSFHEYPGYPGTTGWVDEVGVGPGEGFNLNAPMPAGASDDAFLHAMDKVVFPILRDYRPQMIIVSAGHDLHASDPTGNLDVSAHGIRALTERVRQLGEELGISCVFVLEGGYNQNTLPMLTSALVAGLGDFQLEIDDPFVEDRGRRTEDEERVEAMRAAMLPYWKVLAS